MALQPMGPTTDQQETMFEDPTDFVNADAYEAPDEPSYEAAEDFSEEIPEPVSGGSAASLADEPTPEPITDPEPPSVLTVDDFAALEERVLRAVSLVRREREARTAAEERAVALEAQLHAQNPAIEQLQQEVESLRAEREQVRLRVERLLSQLDALEL
jgi:hypothetical protein